MALRSKVLIPLACAGMVIAGLTVWLGRPAGAGGQLAAVVGPALIALFAVAALLFEFLVHRPLRHALRTDAGVYSAAQDGADELGTIIQAVDGLQAELTRIKAQRARESELRRQDQSALRAAEERYVLAVERTNDGIWEWDTKADRLECSPRWKGLLRYVEGAPASIDQWKNLIHDDDRDAIRVRFDNHLEGLTPCFDAEYRLRRGDGQYLWVHSRGTALRHASGKPYRLFVMDNDIHARKEIEETLIQAAEGLSSVSGMDFFRELMCSLSSILHTRDNIVCHCLDDPPTRVRALAYFTNGAFREEPVEYDLAGTSCGEVIKKGEIVYCPTGVCDIWPSEKEYDRDSYIGVPMFDSNGKIIGHFACMDGAPMRQDLPHLALFKIFSVRAAAELERTLLKEKLEQQEER